MYKNIHMADSSPGETPLTRAEQAKQLQERARWVNSQDSTNIAKLTPILKILSQAAGRNEKAFQTAVRALTQGSTLPDILDALRHK